MEYVIKLNQTGLDTLAKAIDELPMKEARPFMLYVNAQIEEQMKRHERPHSAPPESFTESSHAAADSLSESVSP